MHSLRPERQLPVVGAHPGVVGGPVPRAPGLVPSAAPKLHVAAARGRPRRRRDGDGVSDGARAGALGAADAAPTAAPCRRCEVVGAGNGQGFPPV